MSDEGGSWAPFGPSGDDDPPPSREPATPPESAPPPAEEPVAFAPPVAVPPPPLNWPSPAPVVPEPPPISQWPGPPPQAFGAPRETASNAVASLVLGIVGLVLCPLIASAAAVALGTSAKRQIREDPRLGGSGPATWGVALGWIGIAWGVLIIVALLAGGEPS